MKLQRVKRKKQNFLRESDSIRFFEWTQSFRQRIDCPGVDLRESNQFIDRNALVLLADWVQGTSRYGPKATVLDIRWRTWHRH
jgi:hypothetical protein